MTERMLSITVFEFILLSLATFRITRLIVFDTIITFIRKPFHEIIEEVNDDGTTATYLQIKGTGIKFWIGELLSCYWCVGVWVAAILLTSYIFLPIATSVIVYIFAIAAVASIVEAIISKFV